MFKTIETWLVVPMANDDRYLLVVDRILFLFAVHSAALQREAYHSVWVGCMLRVNIMCSISIN
jgi:hypothetical protein